MSKIHEGARTLPVRPAAGLAIAFLIAGILATWTATECYRNLEHYHLQSPFAPSLLYGCVYWIWWVVVTLILWTVADRWAAVFKPSGQTILAHLGASCVVATAHITLLQHAIWFASGHWPAWGRHYATLSVTNVERFGVELAIYGFVCGVCAFLHSSMQAQEAVVQRLEFQRQLTHAQLKALQMQMEPHFLFNTLNAITSLVAQERNQEAMKTLAHLNTILRTTLERKAPEKVPFAEELKVVESYLAIQKVRFAGRLEVRIDASEEALYGLVPCFLLQPIVENAIQHGIAPKAAGGFIETHVKRVGDTLWMQVRDNGRGPGNSVTKGHGIGMQNTRERLAYFYPGSHEFLVAAPAEGGYEVTIQIPYERAMA
ncbi:MAG: histidine kinase [Terracidiphilus sp.]|jgi:signal transduction histidine kinase